MAQPFSRLQRFLTSRSRPDFNGTLLRIWYVSQVLTSFMLFLKSFISISSTDGLSDFTERLSWQLQRFKAQVSSGLKNVGKAIEYLS